MDIESLLYISEKNSCRGWLVNLCWLSDLVWQKISKDKQRPICIILYVRSLLQTVWNKVAVNDTEYFPLSYVGTLKLSNSLTTFQTKFWEDHWANNLKVSLAVNQYNLVLRWADSGSVSIYHISFHTFLLIFCLHFWSWTAILLN